MSGKIVKVDVGYENKDFDLHGLNRFRNFFLQETLCSLSIGNMDFCCHNEIYIEELPQYTTALENLQFRRCEVNCRLLAELLKAPRALKSLELTETRGIWDGFTKRDPEEWYEGKGTWADVVLAVQISGQAASLGHLELTSYNKHTTIPTLERTLDFSDFPNLRSLRIDRSTNLVNFSETGLLYLESIKNKTTPL